MPLQRKRQLRLTAHQPLPPTPGSDRTPQFEAEGTPFWASLQPVEGETVRRLYGEEVTRLVRLITTEEAALSQGMGIAPQGEACRWRIAEPPARWRTHTVAVLKQL